MKRSPAKYLMASSSYPGTVTLWPSTGGVPLHFQSSLNTSTGHWLTSVGTGLETEQHIQEGEFGSFVCLYLWICLPSNVLNAIVFVFHSSLRWRSLARLFIHFLPNMWRHAFHMFGRRQKHSCHNTKMSGSNWVAAVTNLKEGVTGF